ncbi:MAG: hypothetical protein ACTSPV_18755, partial [Candidatus Hodarchaeales archaeon]
IIFSEGIAFTLLDETVNKYESLAKNILHQNDLSHKFSEKYIERKLQSIIAKIIQSNEKEKYARKLLEDLINSLLSYNQEWIVLVPLSGLEVGLDSIKLGKITIFKMTQQKMEELLTQFDKITLATKNTTEVKQRMIQMSHNIFVESLLGGACAKFQAIAEPERAIERAEEETRRVLDILRYCIPFLYPSNLRVNVSLKGERNRQLRWTSVVSCDEKSAFLRSRVVGPIARFELNNENIDEMRKMGVFKLFNILAKRKQQLSNFEEALLRSIHWFSSHLNQYEIENQFLNLVTCLETLLTPKNNDPVSNTIAEGVAILLITSDDNRDDKIKKRMYMKSRIKKLYGKRSGISHGGSKQIFESEVRELRMIVKILIMEMVRRKDEFQSQKELLSWIEKQKLG